MKASPSGGAAAHRGRARESEYTVFLEPLASPLAAVWRRVHWVIAGLALLYAASGLTFIQANQAGVTLRFGAVTRHAGAPVVHRPGLLFALPRPFDEVLVLDVDRVDTVVINELAPSDWRSGLDAERSVSTTATTILGYSEPGYILTADRHIVHAPFRVRFRTRNPVQSSLWTTDGNDVLRAALLESTIRTAGATGLDELIGAGRQQFSQRVVADAQRRLDRIGAGLEIVSIEYENLFPPEEVAADFDAVQSAYIEAQTHRRDARAYAAAVVPAASAQARQIIADAQAVAIAQTAEARADAASFDLLLPLYLENPELVRQRLYRDRIEDALGSVDRLRFVPAPVADDYRGTRILVSHPGQEGAR